MEIGMTVVIEHFKPLFRLSVPSKAFYAKLLQVDLPTKNETNGNKCRPVVGVTDKMTLQKNWLISRFESTKTVIFA